MMSNKDVPEVSGLPNAPVDTQRHAADHELGFFSSFYQRCRLLLSEVRKNSLHRFSGTSKRQFQESISRFVLWGSGWMEGRLDFCLGGSIQLRNNVTELLSGLARALLQRNDFITDLLMLRVDTEFSMQYHERTIETRISRARPHSELPD